MKIARLVLAVVALVGVLLPAPGVEANPGVIKLRGTNVVSAAKPSWMPVYLPRPVTISTRPFDNPLIEVTSSGSLAMVVLRQDIYRGIEVAYVESDLCGKGCPGEPLASLHTWDPWAKKQAQKMTLPSGRYQLYMVMAGGDATARIELAGLGGRTTLQPKRAADVRSKDVSDATDNPNLYEVAVDHTLSGRGISLVTAELDTDAFAATNVSSCIEASDGEAPSAADGSTCESYRTAGSGLIVDNTARGGRKVLTSMGLLGLGSYEHMLRFRNVSVVRSFTARHLVLGYESSDRGQDWLYSLSMMF